MNDLETKQGKRANAVRNGEFICIETYSGRGLLGRDPQGCRSILGPDADDHELGAALLNALGNSRFLSGDEARQFLDRDRTQQVYEGWVQEMTSLYGYKSRRDLFKKMVCCNVKLIDGAITLTPTSHPKLEAWEGLGDEQNITIPGNSMAAEAGAALRLALNRSEA